MRRIIPAALLVATLLPLVPTSTAAASARLTTPACTSTQISTSFGRADGTAGTIYHPLVFTNVSSRSCVLTGVPAIEPGARTAKGFVAIGPAARNASMGQMGALLTLKPGKSVDDDMGVTDTGNYPAHTCVPTMASSVRVRIFAIIKVASFGSFSVCTKIPSTTTRLLTPAP